MEKQVEKWVEAEKRVKAEKQVEAEVDKWVMEVGRYVHPCLKALLASILPVFSLLLLVCVL